MKNVWNQKEAQAFIERYKDLGEDIALRTYSARLIGKDPGLVLHGGGNTSVKSIQNDIYGKPIRVLYMKGSGWDLSSIEPGGHPALNLDKLIALRDLNELSDEEMVNQLKVNLLDSRSPNPSVETLLHVFLPHKFIDHTHADAVLSITNQPDALKKINDWVGNSLGIVPYIMPGFLLAKSAASIYEKNPNVEGLVLIKHGIFTFGESALESYNRMIYWVGEARKWLQQKTTISYHSIHNKEYTQKEIAEAITILRGSNTIRVATNGTRDLIERFIAGFRSTPKILDFINSSEGREFSQLGPATPDHVIRTKPKPLVITCEDLNNSDIFKKKVQKNIEDFKTNYENYFVRQCKNYNVTKKMLDPLPRIILVPGMGLFAFAPTRKEVTIALDIYEHTIDVITDALRYGNYEALPEKDIFTMEYWSLEQAKLGRSVEKDLSRKIVWISGAASGIGLATAQAFARHGAHIYLTDINEELLKKALELPELASVARGSKCDVTKVHEVEESFINCSLEFGGVDIVISNAGYAPTSPLAECSDEVLRTSFEVNFFAHQNVAKEAIIIMKKQNIGGVLLFNASKSTFNPGPDFGPYTLPKMGVLGLMRQYAIELGKYGIRSNAVNADRVRTRLYSEKLLHERASSRGLAIHEYLSGNLVGEEVYPEDVAESFMYLALARKTTGAVLPVDGGNVAAFPR